MAQSSPEKRTPRSTSELPLVKGFAVTVVCRHCGLKYRANPQTAVCPKCQCRGNKPLDPKNLAIFAILPPWGLVRSLILTRSTPWAAMQGFLATAGGSAVYLAIYLASKHII